MTQDKNLEFLSSCRNDDLRTLCDILTHNSKGELRISEELTNSNAYLLCYPMRMNMMAREIGEELRKFGSNTIKTFYNNDADSYEKILKRVCKKLKVKTNEGDTVTAMEKRMLFTVCEQATARMGEDELRDLADAAGIPHKHIKNQMVGYAIMGAARLNRQVLMRIVQHVVAKASQWLAGRCLPLACTSCLSRGLGMISGPVGWILLTGWTIGDIASPAYRVIIPAVIMVALMRLQSMYLLTA